ncbi:hypothetical protein BSQ97_18435 [Serratia proteamaculans]|nr:hypothetical protein BSQ97_18435 [Serratia proteamaculans]
MLILVLFHRLINRRAAIIRTSGKKSMVISHISHISGLAAGGWRLEAGGWRLMRFETTDLWGLQAKT